MTPEVAFQRALGGGSSRPLFDQADSVKDFSLLLESRRDWYARAEHSVDSELGSPQEIAENILRFWTDEVL